MANVETFNYKIDKITEREVVFDFVTRLSIGKDFINQDFNSSENSGDRKVIFPADTKLKDTVLANIIKALDTSDILHLNELKTTYKKIPIGTKSLSLQIPSGYRIYKIVQESTGSDVTRCFTQGTNAYTITFDVPTVTEDYYKAYYYK